jgi:hypothetical protein
MEEIMNDRPAPFQTELGVLLLVLLGWTIALWMLS